jgi:hypothetical protein
VHVSTMSGKLKGIPAVNCNTLSNSYCGTMRKSGTEKKKVICKMCYSAAMLEGSRKNCVTKFQYNSDWFSVPQTEFPVINSAWFRLHGHGELINDIHFENYIRLADANPQTHFVLWTKRRDIINRYFNSVRAFVDDVDSYLPDNLRLIYSNPIIDHVMLEPPKHFHKVFNTVSFDNELENCTGRKCLDCRICYDKNNYHKFLVEKVKVRR